MTIAREGGCQCRAIRYRIIGEPLTVYACHCTDCQRRSGSAFGMSMIVSKRQLEVLCGTPAVYDLTQADGRRRYGKFCGACAIRLWGESPRNSEIVFVRPGTLDDTQWLDPIAHIWTRSAQPWVVIPDNVMQFAQQPEDMSLLVRAWRDREQERNAVKPVRD